MGDVRFRVSAGLAKLNKIGCGMNKIGWFIKSKHRAGYTRCDSEQNRVVRGEHFLGAVIGACFEASNTEKTVWGAARTQGVVGSGARTRFGGVLQTCVSAPRREKKGTRFCSETTRVYPILSISQKKMIPGKWKARERELTTFDKNRRAMGMLNPLRDKN